MTLYSHPGKLLVDHLREVAGNCKSLVAERILFSNTPGLKQVLQDLAYLAGAFHDLGKATFFFQHYLLSQDHEILGPKNHALISALFVKEIAKRYLYHTQLSLFEKKLLAHLVFIAVKRHHGKLENFEDELYIESKSKELQEQILSFDEEETDIIITGFCVPLSLKYSFKDFKVYILSKEYLTDMPEFHLDSFEDDFGQLSETQKIEHYCFHHLLFGVLLLSDKSDVILEKKQQIQAGITTTDKVDVFREKRGFNKPKSELDEKKNEAFFNALNNLSEVFSADKHIYSITLPTGLGKTVTSFAAALQMKKLLGLPSRRLIVTIPFTSIIDQNFDVYSEIVASENSNVLLKHHHLAEPIYKINEDMWNPDKSEFMIETWQSEIVVTTFVQLLNSIFSNDKSLLMKLPSLANSIIILDEVQTVPYVYWQLIKNAFEVIGRTYNCYFILMSATQPLMFLPGKEIIEIIPDYGNYFKYFNRTRVINKTQNVISLTEFIDVASSYLYNHPSKDVLFIFNTKKHSKQCFETLRNMIDYDAEEVYYLSTLITPYERKKIINLIKDRSGKRKVIVSTQLVEAGVDISVDTVFRALAPLDAIIQSAGRANRYDEKPEQGEVYLYEIEEMRKATSIIYGADLIQKTKNVLKDIDVIEEEDYLELIQHYFKEVRKQSESYLSEFLEGIYLLNFKDVGKFSLIEERETKSVFLQLNEQAKGIWDMYENIWESPSLNLFEKKQEFSKIKATFYDFVINVPIAKSKNDIDFDSEPVCGFYLSKLESPSVFYNYDENNFSVNTGYQEVNILSF